MVYRRGKFFGDGQAMTARRQLLTTTAAVLCIQAAAVVLAQEPQSRSPKYTASVDIVSVTAVVRDRKGRFVRDLERDDFVVAEAGQQRSILDFRSEADGPVKLALLFDVSGSMRLGSKVVDARQAAEHFFSSLRPTDQAAIFAFDSRLGRVLDFTSDHAALSQAIDKLASPYGQTSLYDAVAQTARAVGGRGGSGLPAQRTAVVVLTDGIDTHSRLSPEQVSAIASGIDVPVYVVATLSSIDDPRSTPESRTIDSSDLRALSERTGGLLFTASAPAHASIAARQILDELRHQYVLAFEASSRPGWRPIEVRARDRNLIVRARTGYATGTGEGLPLPSGGGAGLE